jgi:hypothetical protein
MWPCRRRGLRGVASSGRWRGSLQPPTTAMPTPIIVALDFPTGAQAIALMHALGAEAAFYKVGLQLLAEEGPGVVRDLTAHGKHVFLDLKLHEIPNSVAGAVRAAGKLGASMVSVHACAGSAVLRSAVPPPLRFPASRCWPLPSSQASRTPTSQRSVFHRQFAIKSNAWPPWQSIAVAPESWPRPMGRRTCRAYFRPDRSLSRQEFSLPAQPRQIRRASPKPTCFGLCPSRATYAKQ